MTYPKWIQRHPDLGPILAANEEEEALFSGEPAPEPEPEVLQEQPAAVKNKGGRPRKVQ